MVKERKLYDVLSVTPMATPDQIKTAYKQAAKKYHPDRNPNVDPEKFKQVTRAYDILSNADTRAAYDQFGEAGLGNAPTPPPTSSSSTTKSSSAGTRPQATVNTRPKAEDIPVELKLRLEDFYLGTKAQVEAGGATHEVFVDKGMADGQMIRLRGRANNSTDPKIEHGDIVVTLQQLPHARFRREGPHLLITQNILLSQALCGFEFHLPHLDGRNLLVCGVAGEHIIAPGHVKKVTGEGMPLLRTPFNKGNLYITFEVTFPNPGSLTTATMDQLRTLLPSPPVAVKLKQNVNRVHHDEDEVFVENDNQAERESMKRTHEERVKAADTGY